MTWFDRPTEIMLVAATSQGKRLSNTKNCNRQHRSSITKEGDAQHPANMRCCVPHRR